MTCGREKRRGLAAHPLCGRVRDQQLRVPRLERPQLLHQAVVLAVRDLGCVEHVLAIVVVLEPGAQLFDASLRSGELFLLGLVHGIAGSVLTRLAGFAEA